MKTYLAYQTAGSIPLAAVMAGLVVIGSTSNETVQALPIPTRQVTAYQLGNTGINIRIQTNITGDTVVDNYRPRTELGRKLLALRRAYVISGGHLLDSDSLDVEVQLRRGGIADA